MFCVVHSFDSVFFHCVFIFFPCHTHNGYDINAQCSCSKVYCIFFYQSSSEGDCCITHFISKH
jgi:hypothetical protein